MCLIIHKPRGVEIPDIDVLENAVLGNPDGAGIAYQTRAGHIQLRRGLDMTGADLDRILRTRISISSDAVVHTRIATQGTISHMNCQPLPVAGQAIFAHNGNVAVRPGDTKLSDSHSLVNQVIEPLLDCPSVLSTVLSILAWSSHSKFILMTPRRIARYGDWWEDVETGLWYSHKPYSVFYWGKRSSCEICETGSVSAYHYRGDHLWELCAECVPYLDRWLEETEELWIEKTSS